MADRSTHNDRGKHRGRGGANRGRGGRGRGGSHAAPQAPKQILDLAKHLDKKVVVKFNGGREVVGILKGWDTLLNLVLDECQEYERDSENSFKLKTTVRNVGLVICRGTSVFLICPSDGMEEIDNPFLESQ